MKKKRRQFDSSEASQGWLISYADMMTLIACFFILMMAFANFDPVGFTKKTQIVARHFNKDKYKSSETPMKEIQEEIAIHPEIKKFTKTSIKNHDLYITFSGTVLFPGQTANMSPEMEKTLDDLVKIIKTQSQNYKIIVEGHTDNAPLESNSYFSSLWEVSAVRAAKVASRFEFFGFNPKNIISTGMADTKPLAPNEDKDGKSIDRNQRLNSRVVIKVLEPAQETEESIKLGLGVYFDD